MTISDLFRRARVAFTATDKLFQLKEARKRTLKSRLDCLTLEDRLLPTLLPPEILSLQLRNDTGPSDTDLVTWDAAVIGTMSSPIAEFRGVGVEVDLNDDGIADQRVFPDTTGVFLYEPTPVILGEHTVRFRGFQWDWDDSNFNVGPWSSTFKYTIVAAPASPPVLSELTLEADTDIPGDGVTADGTLTGRVNHTPGLTGVRVALDLDQNGVTDAIVPVTASGTFRFVPEGMATGSHLVKATPGIWDAATQSLVNLGDSKTITFQLTQAMPVISRPVISNVKLRVDTGASATDNKTWESAVVGIITSALGTADYSKIYIEVSANNELATNVSILPNEFGEFTFHDPLLVNGHHSLRFRGVEWHAGSQQYLVGTWSAPIEFELVNQSFEPPIIESFALAAIYGNPSVTIPKTFEPKWVGKATRVGQIAGLRIEYDIAGTADEVDGFEATDLDGGFTLSLPLGPGEHSVRIRAGAWDPDAQAYGFTAWTGWHAFEVIERPALATNPPTISGLQLVEDTGTPGDFITSNATIKGVVSTVSANVHNIVVEIDRDDNGTADAHMSPQVDGSFRFDAAVDQVNKHALKFRAVEWDPVSEQVIVGSWSSTFAFTHQIPAVEPPVTPTIQLVRPTGGTGVSFDPTFHGKLANAVSLAGYTIEIDHNDDKIADQSAFVNFDGTFQFTLQHFSLGTNTFQYRITGWDLNTQTLLASDWTNHSFTLTEPTTEPVMKARLLLDTDSRTDNLTFDPRVVVHLSDGANDLPYHTVALNFSGTKDFSTGRYIAERTVMTGVDGRVIVNTPVTDEGTYSVNIWYQEWNAAGSNWIIGQKPFDFDTNTIGSVVDSQDVEFHYEFVPAPAVQTLTLLDESSSTATYPILKGFVAFALDTTNWSVEIDYGGNGIVDDVVLPDTFGKFEYQPFGLLPGQHLFMIRGVVDDVARGKQLRGAWSPILVFDYLTPEIVKPTVTSFVLANDTDIPGDGITADPRLQGTVLLGESPAAFVTVELDTDFDDLFNHTTITDAEGRFTFNHQHWKVGSHAFRARGLVWDGTTGTMHAGDWKTLEFTYEPVVNVPPQVSLLVLKNDTGPNTSDNKTTDPTVIGTAINSDDDAAYLTIEFDEDGDGAIDGTVVTTVTGQFEYYPSRIQPGPVTIRARAVEYDMVTGAYVAGEWNSLEFTYELLPPQPGYAPNEAVTNAEGGFVAILAVVGAQINDTPHELQSMPIQFDLGIGQVSLALGMADPSMSPSSIPFVPTSLQEPLWIVETEQNISTDLWFAIDGLPYYGEIVGTYTHVLIPGAPLNSPEWEELMAEGHILDGHSFAIESNVNYTFNLYQYDGTAAIEISEGSYSFTFQASGIFESQNGPPRIEYGFYSFSEHTSMSWGHSKSTSYVTTVNGTTVSGMTSVSSEGHDTTSRNETGSFSAGDGYNAVNGQSSVVRSGEGGLSWSDTGSYSLLDPRTQASGTYSSSGSNSYSYSTIESSNVTASGSQDPTIAGNYSLQMSSSASSSSNQSGTFKYDYDGTVSNGSYSLTASELRHIPTLDYSGSFTASPSGLTSSGTFTILSTAKINNHTINSSSSTVTTPYSTSTSKLSSDKKTENNIASTMSALAVGTSNDYLLTTTFSTSENGTSKETVTIEDLTILESETTYDSIGFTHTQTNDQTLISSQKGTHITDGIAVSASGNSTEDSTGTVYIQGTSTSSSIRPDSWFEVTSSYSSNGTSKSLQHSHKASFVDGISLADGVYFLENTEQSSGHSRSSSGQTVTSGNEIKTTSQNSTMTQTGSAHSSQTGSFSGPADDVNWNTQFSIIGSGTSAWTFYSQESVSGLAHQQFETSNSSGTGSSSRRSTGTSTKSSADGTTTDSEFARFNTETSNSTSRSWSTYINGDRTDRWRNNDRNTTTITSSTQGSSHEDKASVQVTGSATKLVSVNRGGSGQHTWDDTTSNGHSIADNAHISTTNDVTDTFTIVDGVVIANSGTITVDSNTWNNSTSTVNSSENAEIGGGGTKVFSGTSSQGIFGNAMVQSTTDYSHSSLGTFVSHSASEVNDSTVWNNSASSLTTTTPRFDVVVLFDAAINSPPSTPAGDVIFTSVDSSSDSTHSIAFEDYSYSAAAHQAAGLATTGFGGIHTSAPETISGTNARRFVHIQTFSTSTQSQNTPDWEISLFDPVGSISVTTTTETNSSANKLYNFIRTSAGQDEDGSFTRNAFTIETNTYNQSASRPNETNTQRGMVTENSTGTDRTYSNTTEYGTYTVSFGANPVNDTSATFNTSSQGTINQTYTVSINEEIWDGPVHFREFGNTTTVTNGSSQGSDSGTYSTGSTSIRNGFRSSRGSSSGSTTGTWLSLVYASAEGAQTEWSGKSELAPFTEPFYIHREADDPNEDPPPWFDERWIIDDGLSSYVASRYESTTGSASSARAKSEAYINDDVTGGSYSNDSNSYTSISVADNSRFAFSGSGGNVSRRFTSSGSNSFGNTISDRGTIAAGGAQTGHQSETKFHYDKIKAAVSESSYFSQDYSMPHVTVDHDNQQVYYNKDYIYTGYYSRTDDFDSSSESSVHGSGGYSISIDGTSKRDGGSDHIRLIESVRQKTEYDISTTSDMTWTVNDIHYHESLDVIISGADGKGPNTDYSNYNFSTRDTVTYAGDQGTTAYSSYETKTHGYSRKSDITHTLSINYGAYTENLSRWYSKIETNSHTVSDKGVMNPDGSKTNQPAWNKSFSWSAADHKNNHESDSDVSSSSDLSQQILAALNWIEDTISKYADDVLDVAQTILSVAAVIAPPGVSQALAALDVGISLARGHHVSALDIAAIALPSLKLAKLGAKATKFIVAATRTAEGIEDTIELGVAAFENRQHISKFGNALAAGDLAGAWSAGGSVVTQMALPMVVKALGVRHSPCQGRVIWDFSANQSTCFAAGTPIRTPDGSKMIEQIAVGDRVLARDEFDPDAPVAACRVEEVFVREGLIWELTVGGRTIRTTAEHPHYVPGRGWVACHELRVGDRVLTELGTAMTVEALRDTRSLERVYNFRVADTHTYFVGAPEWGFAVWVHNAYGRGGKQPRLRALLGDPNTPRHVKGWIQNELRHIANGNRNSIRLPGNSRRSPGSKEPGMVLAHPRKLPAREGHDYSVTKLQDAALHLIQHKIWGYV